MRTILAADIGCTNSRFAWFQSDPDASLSLQDGIWLPTGKAAIAGLIFIGIVAFRYFDLGEDVLGGFNRLAGAA